MSRDILHCIQTCHLWNREFNKETVWYEIAKTLSPVAVEVLEIATTTTTTTAAAAAAAACSVNNAPDSSSSMPVVPVVHQENTKKIKYKSMALALAKKTNHQRRFIELPESKLKLMNVLILLEIRDNVTNKNVVTCCSDLLPFAERHKKDFEIRANLPGMRTIMFASTSPSPSTTTINHNNKQLSPPRNHNVFTPMDLSQNNGNYPGDVDTVCDRLEMSLRLIRRDDGTSVCVNTDYEYSEYIEDDNSGHFDSDRLKVLHLSTNTPTGTIARKMCEEEGYEYVQFEVNFTPKAIHGTFPHMDVEDLDNAFVEECKIEYCDIRMTVGLEAGCGGDDGEDFKSVNHFLLFLEGLDWN